MYAAFVGWVICGVLAGFGKVDGGPFRFDAILLYAPGAIGAFFYLRWHYGKMWRDEGAQSDDLETTFK